MATKILDLLTELNDLLRQKILDKDGFVKIQEIQTIFFKKDSLTTNNAAYDFLLSYLHREDFKIKCDVIEDLFYSLHVLTKNINLDDLLPHIVCCDQGIFRKGLKSLKTSDFLDLFILVPSGFEILLELIDNYLSKADTIAFLDQFEDLEEIIPRERHTSILSKLKKIFQSNIENDNHFTKQEIYHSTITLIRRYKSLFPLLFRRIQTIININEYITLKLERNTTNIYIAGKIFNQCKYLFINLTEKNTKDYDYIDSIDEAEEVSLNSELHGGSARKYKIKPETEFWGHASNLQAWVENNYDTRILHRNIAFPLLKRLTEVGAPLARRVFKEEILKRLMTGHSTVIAYLTSEGYLNYLQDDDYREIFQKAKPILFENLIQGLNRGGRYSRHVQLLFDKVIKFGHDNLRLYISQALESDNLTQVNDIIRSGCLKFLQESTIQQFLADPSCPIKNYHLMLKGEHHFITDNLIMNLSNRGITDLREIEGLQRLRCIEVLNLQDNQIQSIRGLENLENLKSLKLKGNPLPRELLYVLGGLDKDGNANHPQMFVEYCQKRASNKLELVLVNGIEYEVFNEKLRLSNLNITDLNSIEGLFNLQDLKFLDLSNNKIENLDKLQLLTSLEYLDLSNNNLKEFPIHCALVNLRTLRLHGNEIYSIKDISKLKNLTIIDLDSRRKIEDTDYLKSLLQSFIMDEIVGFCKIYNLKGYDKLNRDDLINFIPINLIDHELRDLIRKIERDVISNGLREAILSLRYIRNTEDMDRIQIRNSRKKDIKVKILKWDKTEISTSLSILSRGIDNPQHACSCKIGRNNGFCFHFWYNVIFGIKKKVFSISDWTLTILPKNFNALINDLEINKVAQDEYRFINKHLRK